MKTLETIQRNCPVCEHNDYEIALSHTYNSIIGFENANFINNHVICKHCGQMYTNPAPSESALMHYYAHFSHHTNSQYENHIAPEAILRHKRTFDLISQKMPPNFKGSILEIGCGTGASLHIFKQNGWNTIGVEPSITAAHIAKTSYDIHIIPTIFTPETLPLEYKFDAIILSHTLEHLIHPETTIQTMKRFLSPNGVIYIEVPNLLEPLLAPSYFHFAHVNYFTPNTLTRLLNKNGFQASIYTYEHGFDINMPVLIALAQPSNIIIPNHQNDFSVSTQSVLTYNTVLESIKSDISNKIHHILETFTDKKIAIWGAGLHTNILINLLKEKASCIHCLFDNDPQKDGTTLNHIPIISPKNLNDIIGTVDCIIISSKKFENEIYETLHFLKNHGISIFKLYHDNK